MLSGKRQAALFVQPHPWRPAWVRLPSPGSHGQAPSQLGEWPLHCVVLPPKWAPSTALGGLAISQLAVERKSCEGGEHG